MAEYFSDILLYWFPFYYLFKTLIVLYLALPQFRVSIIYYDGRERFKCAYDNKHSILCEFFYVLNVLILFDHFRVLRLSMFVSYVLTSLTLKVVSMPKLKSSRQRLMNSLVMPAKLNKSSLFSKAKKYHFFFKKIK